MDELNVFCGGGGQLLRSLEFSFHGPLLRRAPGPGSGPATAITRFRWTFDVADLAVLDDQLARKNERGDLGIAKVFQQTEHVPVNRFGPEFLPRIEIPAD